MNEEYVWRFASALLCLLCRTEGGNLGVTRFVTCKLLLFVVPLFAAVMWEGNSDPPCMSARVSVRISMGGSWDTSHHCLPPLFSFSLSQKKKRNQTVLNKHKEKSMTMTAVLLFFIEINRWHCTHLNYKWLIVSMWPRIRSLDWMGVNPISVRLPNPVMNSGL